MMSVFRSLLNATCEPPRTAQRSVPRARRASRVKRHAPPHQAAVAVGPTRWKIPNSNGLNILNQDDYRLQTPAGPRLADRQPRAVRVHHSHGPWARSWRNRAIRVPEVLGG